MKQLVTCDHKCIQHLVNVRTLGILYHWLLVVSTNINEKFDVKPLLIVCPVPRIKICEFSGAAEPIG